MFDTASRALTIECNQSRGMFVPMLARRRAEPGYEQPLQQLCIVSGVSHKKSPHTAVGAPQSLGQSRAVSAA